MCRMLWEGSWGIKSYHLNLKMAVRLAEMSFSYLPVSVVCSVAINTSYVQRELEETQEACALKCARLTCAYCGTQADVISFLLVLWKLYMSSSSCAFKNVPQWKRRKLVIIIYRFTFDLKIHMQLLLELRKH